MNKRFLTSLLLLFPFVAFAQDGSMSFAPPPSDYSVIFLGNIFGIVDGVLHGNGSQIMGSMFTVLNAAVLALGGIVIMYTLLVATMNTAHSGEMLGKQWSSMWIPIRSTVGLALLIPKASGYCLMQIFVMWIVIQGVGAADKVWDAALGYLGRGGAIVQVQANPVESFKAARSSGVAGGVLTILAGQVCMLGLQTQLDKQLESYNRMKQDNIGPCAGTPSGPIAPFCGASVPNFINTVNAVVKQNESKGQSVYTLSMPNFDIGSPFAQLNGICGAITWNAFPTEQLDLMQQSISTVSTGDRDTAAISRAIAIQQMYLDMSNVAQVIVGNDPALSKSEEQPDKVYSEVAIEQFGVPLSLNGAVCQDSLTPDCFGWGPASGQTGVSLLNGTEFQGAISDYNGIMAPTLTLVQQAKTSESSNLNRNFIQYASAKGWIMAGSYFFDLIQLNMAAQQFGGTSDTNTGLEQSSFSMDNLSSAFSNSQGTSSCGGKYGVLCVLFGGDPSAVNDVINLIDGSTSSIGPIPLPDLAPLKTRKVIDGPGSSTVYGYANNASILQLPGQPGNKALMFDKLVYVPDQVKPQKIPNAHFSCGRVGLLGCVGRALGNLFMNKIFLGIYNLFISIFSAIISDVVMSFVVAPLSGMAEIFNQGIAIISKPGVNPIVALANMGTYYINFAGEMWLQMLFLAITSSILPYVGPFIFALISMAMPIMVTWLSLMVSVGFITAYYIPIMPYMVFVFGGIAWLMAVIEAMVAAPIIALGVTQPEGHESFGKAEPAIMILMNIFLRPSMMIIGFIAAISLSYVSVWVINAGFSHAISFVQASSEIEETAPKLSTDAVNITAKKSDDKMAKNYQMKDVGVQGGYSGWAGVFAYFFSILAYTTMYLTVVQKAFTLISILPDKILRWIGGQPESYGSESGQWGEEAKGKIEKAGDASNQAQAQTGKQMKGAVTKAMGSLPGAGGGGDVKATGNPEGGGDQGGGDQQDMGKEAAKMAVKAETGGVA